jgi:hypothetical protein
VGASVTVTGAGATRPDAETDRARVVTTLQETADAVVLRAVYQPRIRPTHETVARRQR